jgi:bacterioferritin-associated ferredoxin
LDIKRPLGRIGERMEPWFYETRFMSPRFARQSMLGVLRRLSSAPPLPGAPASRGGPLREITTDVVVVGGGPAGLGAAAAAARRTSVVIVTRARLGGSLPPSDPVRATVRADAEALASAGGIVLHSSLCIGRYTEEDLFVVVTPDGPVLVRADRVVVATGAYDRPLLLRGTDLPGVVGLRGFQALAAQGAFRGRTVGVTGWSHEIARAVATAEAFGLDVRWTSGSGDPSPVAIEGSRRASGIRLADGDVRAADVIVLATTQPTYELQLHLGGTPLFDGTPPVIRVDPSQEVPTLVVGEAAGWTSTEGTGERAGAAAGAWLDGQTVSTFEATSNDIPTSPPHPDAVVCICEDVRHRDVERAIDEGFGDVELVKRRSGATTGACQGKLCLPLLAESFAHRGVTPSLPAVRPPIRPVAIAALGGVTG